MDEKVEFADRNTIEQVEEGYELAPKFDANGLLPCVTTSSETGEVLMLGYMNDLALKKTIESGEAHYWSRSRQCLWRKGETSGLKQRVVEMRIDDDQGRIWEGDLSPASQQDPHQDPRAVPVVEAMTALVLADMYLLNKNSKL